MPTITARTIQPGVSESLPESLELELFSLGNEIVVGDGVLGGLEVGGALGVGVGVALGCTVGCGVADSVALWCTRTLVGLAVGAVGCDPDDWLPETCEEWAPDTCDAWEVWEE